MIGYHHVPEIKSNEFSRTPSSKIIVEYLLAEIFPTPNQGSNHRKWILKIHAKYRQDNFSLKWKQLQNTSRQQNNLKIKLLWTISYLLLFLFVANFFFTLRATKKLGSIAMNILDVKMQGLNHL